jgi:hypothetical protein
MPSGGGVKAVGAIKAGQSHFSLISEIRLQQPNRQGYHPRDQRVVQASPKDISTTAACHRPGGCGSICLRDGFAV